MRRVLIMIALVALTGAGVGAWALVALRSDVEAARRERVSMASTLREAREHLTELEGEIGALEERIHKRDQALVRLRGCFSDEAGLAGGFIRGPLRGDVDGDSAPDRVYGLAFRTASSRCQFRLLVETRPIGYTATVGRPIDRTSHGYFLQPVALVDLDANPGKEVLVGVHRGAHTSVGVVFSFSGGRLVRMSVEGAHRDLFSWGGSAGNGSAVDCLPDQPGKIVYSVYSYGEDPQDGLYDVTRHIYRAAGTSFEVVTESKHQVHWKQLTETFPEFGGYPFDGCRGRIPVN